MTILAALIALVSPCAHSAQALHQRGAACRELREPGRTRCLIGVRRAWKLYGVQCLPVVRL